MFSTEKRIALLALGASAATLPLVSAMSRPADISPNLAIQALEAVEYVFGLNFMVAGGRGRMVYLGIPTVYRGLKTVATKSYGGLKSAVRKSNDILKPIFGKMKRQRSENSSQNYPNVFYGLPLD
jgi:hypothetical protein